MSRLRLGALGLALSVLAGSARAQSAAPIARSTRDSLATAYTLAAILHELSGSLSQQAFDTSPAPWTIAFPTDSSGIRWPLIDRELRRLLRARPQTDADVRRSHLRIISAQNSSDSLIVEFDIGSYRRCAQGNAWQGSHTSYRLAVAWSPPTAPGRAQWVEHGDMAPCPGSSQSKGWN